MRTVWTEEAIREEIVKLDKKTGLKGAELPIHFMNARSTLGMYCAEGGGMFKFSSIYFDNPRWPDEAALDVIRHEYAHYMDHKRYGNLGHGHTWKICCGIVGARSIRCYNSKHTQSVIRKNSSEETLSKKLDDYSLGDRILHPVYGLGVIEQIEGEALKRSAVVRFGENETKKMLLTWIEKNCQKS